jgi:hypothetical protein
MSLWAFSGRARDEEIEIWSMKGFNETDSLQLGLHGASWIRDGKKYKLGSAVVDCKDPRDGHQHQPHPLLQQATSFLEAKQEYKGRDLNFVLCGVWLPTVFEIKEVSAVCLHCIG